MPKSDTIVFKVTVKGHDRSDAEMTRKAYFMARALNLVFGKGNVVISRRHRTFIFDEKAPALCSWERDDLDLPPVVHDASSNGNHA
jgi:hypothetical protein